MYCPNETVESNSTGLRYAWERCLGQLPPYPVWWPLEPNGYNDFGATYTNTARNPINPTRQRMKGTVTDMDAQGGFSQDLTQDNLADLLQGFMFANARERFTTAPLSMQPLPITSVSEDDSEFAFSDYTVTSVAPGTAGTGYRVGDVLALGTTAAAPRVVVTATNAAGGVTGVALDFGGVLASTSAPAPVGGTGTGCTVTATTARRSNLRAGDLVLATGFTSVLNNGLHTVAANAAGTLEVSGTLSDETPPPAAALRHVGHQFAAGAVSVALNGGLVRLASATADMSLLGLRPGDWIYVGGDAAGNRFAANYGMARVAAVTAGYLELDKVDWTPTADAGTGVALQVFFGTALSNAADPADIVRRTLQLERTLGDDVDGTMCEYLTGASCNELTLNVGQAALCTVDLAFVACAHEPRSGSQGLKLGTRPAMLGQDAFNSTDHVARVRLCEIDPTTATPRPLVGHFTDISLSINNNVSGNKAVGTLGAFATSAGKFEVAGELQAYFTDMAGPLAVRRNADLTLDYVFIKDGAGIVWDIPLLGLGGGTPNVEPDQPIMLPLENNAAMGKFGYTLLVQFFPYLPELAG